MLKKSLCLGGIFRAKKPSNCDFVIIKDYIHYKTKLLHLYCREINGSVQIKSDDVIVFIRPERMKICHRFRYSKLTSTLKNTEYILRES